MKFFTYNDNDLHSFVSALNFKQNYEILNFMEPFLSIFIFHSIRNSSFRRSQMTLKMGKLCFCSWKGPRLRLNRVCVNRIKRKVI